MWSVWQNAIIIQEQSMFKTAVTDMRYISTKIEGYIDIKKISADSFIKDDLCIIYFQHWGYKMQMTNPSIFRKRSSVLLN